MAKYVSEKQIKSILSQYDQKMTNSDQVFDAGAKGALMSLLKCSMKELNPWIPLEEFLKSGFEGLCWICLKGYPLTYARFSDGEFDKDDALVNDKLITHVQPIHKPEQPQDD